MNNLPLALHADHNPPTRSLLRSFLFPPPSPFSMIPGHSSPARQWALPHPIGHGSQPASVNYWPKLESYRQHLCQRSMDHGGSFSAGSDIFHADAGYDIPHADSNAGMLAPNDENTQEAALPMIPRRHPAHRNQTCGSKSRRRRHIGPSRCRYGFGLYALSPRDGGWVRWGTERRFKTEALCWDCVFFLRPLWELADDYRGFKVVRTITFHKSKTWKPFQMTLI